MYIYMGPGLLDIDPTVLLFSRPPRGAPIHLACVWRFCFSPCPALCGSARDGVVRAGSAPELSKSLIRGIAQAGRATSGQRHSQALPFSAGICASRVGPPSLQKSVQRRFAARPGAFSKDISARTVFRGKSDHAFRRRGVHFFGRSANCVFQGCRKVGFHLGAILFL